MLKTPFRGLKKASKNTVIQPVVVYTLHDGDIPMKMRIYFLHRQIPYCYLKAISLQSHQITKILA